MSVRNKLFEPLMFDFVSLFNQNGKCVKSIKPHQTQITDLQLSKDSTMFITSSKDTSAKVCGMSDDMKHLVLI